MDYANILFEVKEDTAFLIIDRPPMNILDTATMEEMNEAFRSLRRRKDVKVLVISGSGDKAFSSGVDVSDHTGEKVEPMLRAFHGLFRNLLELDQVCIAAAKGYTLGGGCEVAMFCDLVFAADNLKIGQPEIKLSAVPPVALLVLPRIVGWKHAADLLLSGRVIDALEAQKIGLVNRVVPLDSFDTDLEAFIRPFSELSLVGLKYSKRGMLLGMEMPFLEALEQVEKMYLEELMSTRDAQEGLKAFLEKRKPVWKNR